MDTEGFEGRSHRLLSFLRLIAIVLLAGVAACGGNDSSSFPDIITLPTGFQPEGVAISGDSLFVGSIPTGRVYRANIRTGLGELLVDSRPGRNAIGMKVDGHGQLFVAGGQTGQAYVYDALTGADVSLYTLAQGSSFINDVVITPQAAWFTDSLNPVLYRVPIDLNGSPGPPASVTSLTLSGDFQLVPGQTNVNGIAATPDGSVLIIVQTNTGKLFTVNPADGATREINLGADTVANGDGILLEGQTLFVVQNVLNQVAVLTLSADLRSASVNQVIRNAAFDVPTTVAANEGSLYLVNARFGIADPGSAGYSVVRINKP